MHTFATRFDGRDHYRKRVGKGSSFVCRQPPANQEVAIEGRHPCGQESSLGLWVIDICMILDVILSADVCAQCFQNGIFLPLFWRQIIITKTMHMQGSMLVNSQGIVSSERQQTRASASPQTA